MLAVIDYGAGNLRSVLHALAYLGAQQVHLVRSAADLQGATQIILPGVGAFGAGMQALHRQRLVAPLRAALAQGIPYLGICLGMQFLFEYSDEMGTHEGLGVLPGYVTRFPPSATHKVPHMGWNQVALQKASPLVDGLHDGSYAYFVHSYYCQPARPEDVLLTVAYSIPFTAGVARDQVYGVQFHPEKSQQVGLQILRNFLTMGGAAQ
ncbi:MAG: imidazole glycerol phosphate synthase subunit HisH [Anaerolineae bacterium]|jgi:glutamine amidotransferase|nr:imidazole glycerol phosphate synthase subunit HisH [Anaerolineae bacterium]